MDRLDPEYSALKKQNNDSSKSAAEKAEVADKLTAREKHLQPAYQSIALLYADLHEWVHCVFILYDLNIDCTCSRTGRMEAKGCAKPAVWKDARRFFYWALRRKVILSSHIGAILDASPSLSKDAAKELLFTLLPSTTNIKDNRAMTEALEKLNLDTTVTELREAEITRQVVSFMRSPNRKAALNGLLSAAQSLTDDEKALLRSTLASSSVEHSPGECWWCFPLVISIPIYSVSISFQALHHIHESE